MLTDNKRKLIFDTNGKFTNTIPFVLNNGVIEKIKSDIEQ